MYETQVTVVGNLLTDVDNRRLNDGTVVANFRVASKERRFDRSGGTWVDGDRLYIDVRCWRGLAQNALESLKKGDPVVVTGRIFTRNQLLASVWRYDYTGDGRTIDVHVSWLRGKLRAGEHDYFRTVRGVGYAFSPPPA